MFLENTVNQNEQFGWIEVICGSMFSGKTEELIRRLKRAQIAQQRVEIFKPAIDTRYDDELVTSHDQNQIRSTPVPAAANIPLLVNDCEVVGIDEAQFFDDEIVQVCNDLANRGIRVIVAGLDMDFKGNPFGPMPALMATAEYVTKVHAVCTRTGNLAQFSHRTSSDDGIVVLGEKETYEPLSRAAFYKENQKSRVKGKKKHKNKKEAVTQLEIDLNNLTHNYNCLRQKLASDTKFIAVVKANAYGQGAIEIAQKLVRLGADWLAVAYTEEGVSLRQAGIQCPILVFYPQFENIDRLIEHQLEPALYSTAFILAFSKALHAKNKTHYPAHLKCNTGLNRIGLSEEDLNAFLAQKETFPFKLKSVYSHLGASENKKPCTFTEKQITRFLALKTKVEQAYSTPPLFHLVNTSGIFNYPECHFDAVRCGIGLYGFANQTDWDRSLLPIARLSSSIVQLHTVEKGESVGYNQGWIAAQKSQIAVLPIGHADGINRSFGKEVGGVWINGQHAPIVGNVCMDMIMVDVTNINCELHQKAILFDTEHTADHFAKNAGTISYELLTALSPRIKRSIL